MVSRLSLTTHGVKTVTHNSATAWVPMVSRLSLTRPFFNSSAMPAQLGGPCGQAALLLRQHHHHQRTFRKPWRSTFCSCPFRTRVSTARSTTCTRSSGHHQQGQQHGACQHGLPGERRVSCERAEVSWRPYSTTQALQTSLWMGGPLEAPSIGPARNKRSAWAAEISHTLHVPLCMAG